MNRRTFLGTITAATIAANRLSWAAAEHKISRLGVQLYTVRYDMAKDFDGTLSKVAAAGYKEVELAEFKIDGGQVTYFGKSPKDMRAALDQHGLVAPSTHVSFAALAPDNFSKVIEASKLLGNQYIVNPWIEEEIRKAPDGWKHATDVLNRAGSDCKKAGLQFAYHNHWFEFLPVDGKLPYDILLTQCDPHLVQMEMDLCWIKAAGADPLTYFNRYPGRFPMVHVKDLKTMPHITAGGPQDFGDTADLTEVGSGMIDWKDLFAHAGKAGIKIYIVEHDHPKQPIESIKASHDYLEKLRF